jgi:vancomycin resistance protein YoaR
VPVGILVLLVSAWAIDALTQSGHVQRNVTLGDRDVGGLSSEQLTGVVDELAGEYAETAVTIETPNGTFDTTLADLGVSVDPAATEDDTLETGGGGFVLVRPFRWVGTLLGEREAPLTFVVDRGQVDTALAPLVEANQVAPVEPTIQVAGAGIEAVPGTPGTTIEPDQVVDALVERSRDGDFTEPIVLEPVTVPTTFTDEDAQAAADEANQLTANPLTITVADQAVEVPRETMVSWFQPSATDNGFTAEMNRDAVQGYLDEAFASLRVEPVDAGFTLGGLGVEITPDAQGQACCTDDSVDRIVGALDAGQTSVALDLEIVPPGRSVAQAQAMGIIEPISSFTTNYAGGQPRGQNIHRMADIVRGAVIEPGATFSLNEFVGPRTRAKGFVEAGVIYRGVYESDVGGGVSQFATTTFNAAFFGGLDYGEYQSHSIYIDRYPYGREATVSYPNPDLQIINNTPYGVMIWTDYTSTSITVTLWSTKTMTADQTGQSRSSQGRCTRVTTERTRTWLADGHSESDTVFAVYRPGEGVNC